MNIENWEKYRPTASSVCFWPENVSTKKACLLNVIFQLFIAVFEIFLIFRNIYKRNLKYNDTMKYFKIFGCSKGVNVPVEVKLRVFNLREISLKFNKET